MYVGMRVTIDGLNSRPELNGLVGTAVSFEASKGRYAVQLANSDEKLALKAANLSLAADEEESAPTPEDDGRELLECARYGEHDELKQLLDRSVPAGFTDDQGTTALHYAAANGHLECVQLLAGAGCPHAANASGNLPLHWAVQQGHLDVTRALLSLYPEADVLAQNSFGKSVSSEAFAKGDAALVEVVLGHSSASKLEPEGGEGGEDGMEGEVTHAFRFGESADGAVVHVRELGELGAFDPSRILGARMEEDRTGLQLWAASLVLSRWMYARARHVAKPYSTRHLARTHGASTPPRAKPPWSLLSSYPAAEPAHYPTRHDLPRVCSVCLPPLVSVQLTPQIAGRGVIELGAGCGVCGLVAAAVCGASQVIITDLAPVTMDNLAHNVAINGLSAPRVVVAPLDWRDPATWPAAQPVVIGADLIYADEAVAPLTHTIEGLVAPGGAFIYVCPETNRRGEEAFLTGLVARGWGCQRSDVPPSFLANALAPEEDGTPVSDDDFYALFAELKQRTYSLYCFTRMGERDAPPPLPPQPAQAMAAVGGDGAAPPVEVQVSAAGSDRVTMSIAHGAGGGGGDAMDLS